MTEDNTIILSSDAEVDKTTDPRWAGLTFETDIHNRVWTYDENGKSICGAKTRNGTPCRKSPVSGRNRCRLHGGRSLSGVDHPNAKHLRYSQDMVGRKMLNRYETAFFDPDLLSLKGNIALADVRISEIVSSMDSGESQKAWEALRKAYDAFVDAHNLGDSVGAVEHLNEMGRLIRFGVDHYNKWDEVRQTSDHRRRLAETEHKMKHDMNQIMTHDQAMGLLGHVVLAVRKRILEYFPTAKGQECLAAISQDIAGKISTDPRRANESEDF